MSAVDLSSNATVYERAGTQADFLRIAAARILGRHSRVTDEMVEIGKELAVVRAATEHGLFIDWLEREVHMEARLAQKYMRAAEWAIANAKLVSHLQPTAVMELAAKSTPATVIEAVEQRVNAGEVVSPTVVRALLSNAREEKRVRERREKEDSATKRTKEARKARLEREEKERAERLERQKQLENRSRATREMIAAFLVRYLPEDALNTIVASVSIPWNEPDLRIWEKAFQSGVMVSPMKDAIEAARSLKSAT